MLVVRFQVKVGRYYLEQLIADLDSSKDSSNMIRQRLGNPTALGNFLQLCHLRLLHERDVSAPPLLLSTLQMYNVCARPQASSKNAKVLLCVKLMVLVSPLLVL